jgi:D-alanine-D-alanine ligase
MSKVNLHIEIIRSSIKALSSLGVVSAHGLKKELSKKYSHVSIQTIDTFKDLEDLALRKPDLVFNGIKTIPSSESSSDKGQVWVADFLEQNGIMCTGSDATSHELELDKGKSKRCIQQAGLPTSAFIVVSTTRTKNDLKHTLKYPLFVKPLDRGGGFGIDSYSVVNSLTELESKIKSLTACTETDSLVEEFLPGKEYSVAILKDTDDSYFTMSLELIAPKNKNGDRILSERVKFEDTETFEIISDQQTKIKVEGLALKIFKALGARDYGRIDIRLNNDGEPQFLEANLIPSLLENYGNFPKACMLNNSITYSEMLQRIIDLTLKRRIISKPFSVATDILSHNIYEPINT